MLLAQSGCISLLLLDCLSYPASAIQMSKDNLGNLGSNKKYTLDWLTASDVVFSDSVIDSYAETYTMNATMCCK